MCQRDDAGFLPEKCEALHYSTAMQDKRLREKTYHVKAKGLQAQGIRGDLVEHDFTGKFDVDVIQKRRLVTKGETFDHLRRSCKYASQVQYRYACEMLGEI